MLEVNTKPYKEIIARYYAKALVLSGKGDDYAPGQTPWSALPFEGNVFSHSEIRYGVEKFLFTTWPSLTTGGATAKWVFESLKATKKIDKLSISTPVLMFQAGEDQIVMPERQNSFCKSFFCEKVIFPEARHEILMEKDSLRDEALRRIALFFGFEFLPENRNRIPGI
jgi:lysophospholipase